MKRDTLLQNSIQYIINYQKPGIIIIIILAALAPFYLSPFMLTVAIRILYMTILVYSLSFLARGGLVSLGQTIFFGLAGYTLAILLMNHGYSHISSILLGFVVAIIGAIILGLIVIRTESVYFIMITLALGQMAWAVALQWSSLTHGDDGIIGIRPPDIFGIPLRNRVYFFYLSLLIFMGVIFLLKKVYDSKFGLALKAVSENTDKMKSLGYNTALIKYVSFVISGFLSALAGILFVYYNGIINPVTIGINQAVWILVAAILGGINTLIGPLIGVASVIYMQVQISRYTDRYMIVIGTVFVIVVLFMPEGIWGYVKNYFQHQVQKLK